MQYLTGQLVVSYRSINRFRIAEGMEKLIRDFFIDLNLRLKMEELVTLDCLFIDGTKIEANANKYSFVWKKATDKFSVKLQEQIQAYFQEEITPLIIRKHRRTFNRKSRFTTLMKRNQPVKRDCI
ncbi:transposase (08) [Streptococcus oralis]|uniref:Transposase (08) n=2 Tax=Streptococcus oralis TaxID=1303 RepID=A0A139RLG6_STROR|nr:transposase (08) [Streptococcus oralis]